MRKIALFTLAAITCAECSTSSIKDNINRVGDVAGQTAGEFIEGASKGVRKAFDVKIHLSERLREEGLQLGKCTVSSDTVGTDNLLVVYVIFDNDFNGKLTAKVFDEQSQEMGRSGVTLSGKKGDATFAEFHFDKRTNIDSKNVLTIE